MRYHIQHQTVYQYNQPVSVSHHVLRLSPRGSARQQILAADLEVTPSPAVIVSRSDYFGNEATFVTIEGEHQQLAVTARSVVEILPFTGVDPDQTPAWEMIREACHGGTSVSAASRCGCEFAFPSTFIASRPEFAAYATVSFPSGRPILRGCLDLMERIHRDFKFDPRSTTVATPVEKVFQQRRGVCQDFAQFQIASLRSMGLAARYVSGYLETAPPPGQPKLTGADASHAWVQVWCGESGWADLDPTNNLQPGERHVTLAVGRDFDDVSPLRGVLLGSGKHQLKVAVDVVPLDGNGVV